eukprot:6197587-Pleurochrysis_carterae.AAC.3
MCAFRQTCSCGQGGPQPRMERDLRCKWHPRLLPGEADPVQGVRRTLRKVTHSFGAQDNLAGCSPGSVMTIF